MFRRITLVAVWALGFIIVTGGAVRVTGSGLGCSNWPTCSAQNVVAPWQYHAMIEFGNRVVTGIVSVAVILAVLGSMVRAPRRRDLTWLSWGLVAGLVGQIVLGGESVKHNLAPGFIMAHFLLSIVLLTDAVVLHHRAGLADGPSDDRGRAAIAGRPVPLVSRDQVLMARLLLVAAGLVVVLGTVVTSSGPHGGDPKAHRLQYSLHDVAQWHSLAVWLFLALTVVTLWTVQRSRAPASVTHRGELLLLVILAQGGLGYFQYFTGVPSGLVAIHIAMAALLWAVTVRFALGLFAWPAKDEQPATNPAEPAPAVDPILATR
jgi:cytochrome c oxidase assembly protein subunit 15